MVDIKFIIGSSLTTQQGTEQEATSHSRAGRSRRTNALGASTVVGITTAIAHQQRLATTTAVPPPGAGPKATLEVAR
jgi:hypothetical protein